MVLAVSEVYVAVAAALEEEDDMAGMRKVGIVTLVGYVNFGNRLQNYALQECIRSLGFDVLSIKNTPRFGDGAGPIQRRMQILQRRGLHAFMDKARSMSARMPSPIAPRESLRIKGNLDFTQRYLRESNWSFEELSDTAEFARGFEYFVVGSDQVWNPDLRELNHIDFLTFAAEAQRVAYAASMGVSHLSRYDQRRYKAYLSGIPEISVREYRAAEIVHDITGRCVPVVLDPTMLMNVEKWRGLTIVPQGLASSDYIAKFYLGEEEEGRRALIDEFARKRGLRIVNMNDPESIHYCTSPSDFLGAISKAQFVATDSFHAAVFSTLFETPYVITGRGQMNSRFSTLERKTGIRAADWATLADLRASMEVDWDSVRTRIDHERKESHGFLANSLGRPDGRG